MQSPAMLSVYKVRENPVDIKTLPRLRLHATVYEVTCLLELRPTHVWHCLYPTALNLTSRREEHFQNQARWYL